jgi:hypothetical protein
MSTKFFKTPFFYQLPSLILYISPLSLHFNTPPFSPNIHPHI